MQRRGGSTGRALTDLVEHAAGYLDGSAEVAHRQGMGLGGVVVDDRGAGRGRKSIGHESDSANTQRHHWCPRYAETSCLRCHEIVCPRSHETGQVAFARGPANGFASVNVVLGQSGSAQCQTRLVRSRTGLPKQGMSWSRNPAASVPTATTPQPGQPARSPPVSTCRTRPDAVVMTALTWMPSTPSSVSARVHHWPWEQDIELVMSGSLFGFGCLVAANSKRP